MRMLRDSVPALSKASLSTLDPWVCFLLQVSRGLAQNLGDHYVIIPSRTCGSEFGFPIARLRQLSILVLRDWAFANFRAIGRTDLCSDTAVARVVDLKGTLQACCSRTCAIPWRGFLVSSGAGPVEEHARNAARPTVVARWSAIEAGDTSTTSAGGAVLPVYGDDVRASALGALYPSERHRLDECMAIRSDRGGVDARVDVADLSQSGLTPPSSWRSSGRPVS